MLSILKFKMNFRFYQYITKHFNLGIKYSVNHLRDQKFLNPLKDHASDALCSHMQPLIFEPYQQSTAHAIKRNMQFYSNF